MRTSVSATSSGGYACERGGRGGCRRLSGSPCSGRRLPAAARTRPARAARMPQLLLARLVAQITAEHRRRNDAIPPCVGSREVRLVPRMARGGSSRNLACEPNILVADAVEDDVGSATALHPFEPMIAIFALEDA